MRKTLPSNFLAQVSKQTNGCWHWTGRIDPKTGYGSCAWGGRSATTAHRVAYEIIHGPQPRRGEPGHQQIDHECHNRSKSCAGGPTCLHRRCVNPAHLASKLPKANSGASAHTVASKNRAKTHCIRGHELAGDNLRVGSDGRRSCYTCHLTLGSEARRQRRARERPEDWKRSYPQKAECKQGHPLSGDNLRVDPRTGQRMCATCRQAASRRHAETKRTGEVPTGQRADWTHCKHGHAFDEVNTYWHRSGDRWKRACRTCKANRDRR